MDKHDTKHAWTNQVKTWQNEHKFWLKSHTQVQGEVAWVVYQPSTSRCRDTKARAWGLKKMRDNCKTGEKPSQNLTNLIMQTHDCEEEKESHNLHEETKKRWGLELSQKWGWRNKGAAGFCCREICFSLSVYTSLSLPLSLGWRKWIKWSNGGSYIGVWTEITR